MCQEYHNSMVHTGTDLRCGAHEVDRFTSPHLHPYHAVHIAPRDDGQPQDTLLCPPRAGLIVLYCCMTSRTQTKYLHTYGNGTLVLYAYCIYLHTHSNVTLLLYAYCIYLHTHSKVTLLLYAYCIYLHTHGNVTLLLYAYCIYLHTRSNVTLLYAYCIYLHTHGNVTLLLYE